MADSKDQGAVYYPKEGTPLNPMDHPATDKPNASEHYWGTQVNTDAKSDMLPKSAGTGMGGSGSNRYGGADLPTDRVGTNQRHFYEVRD